MMKYIEEEYSAEIKIQRSVFIGHINKTSSLEEAKEYIRQISKKHNKANHNCWAYALGETGEIFHSSDNGEPSGSAGKPILRSLQKNELTYITAVVTRYFGGVKLGVRGLIDAYSQAVEEAIQLANTKSLIKMHSYKIKSSYAHHDKIVYELKQIQVIIQNKEYGQNIIFHLLVEEPQHHLLENFLQQNQNNLEILSYEVNTLSS